MSSPANNGPPELGQTSALWKNPKSQGHAFDPLLDIFEGKQLRTLLKVFSHYKFDTGEDWTGLLNKIEIVTKSFIDITVSRSYGISKFKPLIKEAIELGFFRGERFYMIIGEAFNDSEDTSRIAAWYFTFPYSGDFAVCQRTHVIRDSISLNEYTDPENCLHEYVRMCGDWIEIRHWYLILAITKELFLDENMGSVKRGTRDSTHFQFLFDLRKKWENLKEVKEVELHSKSIKPEGNVNSETREIASTGPSKQSQKSEVQRTGDSTYDSSSSLNNKCEHPRPLRQSTHDTSSNGSPQPMSATSPPSSSVSMSRSIQENGISQQNIEAPVAQPDPPAPASTTIRNEIRMPTDVEDPSGETTAIRSKEEYITLISRYEKEQQDAHEQETEAEQQIAHHRDRLAEAEATKASSKRKAENAQQKLKSVIDRTPLELTRQLLFEYTSLRQSEGDDRRNKRPRTS